MRLLLYLPLKRHDLRTLRQQHFLHRNKRQIYCQVAHIFAKYYKSPENVSYYYTHSMAIVEKKFVDIPDNSQSTTTST